MRVSDRVIEIVQDLECHHQGTDLSINGRTLTGVLRDIAERARVEEDARSSLRAALNGVCGMLGLTERDGLPDMPEVIRTELERRLMPEGMEWPRYDTGEPARPGDRLLDKGGDWFEAASFVFTCDWWSVRGYQTEGFGDLNDKTRRKLEGMAYGTCVKRPAPKLLAADGEPLEVGQTVWRITDGMSVTVERFNGATGFIDSDGVPLEARYFTHQRPVLDANGVPIELGDDLYSVEGSLKLHVSNIDRVNCRIATSAMFALDKWADPSMFTHTKPEPPDSYVQLYADMAGRNGNARTPNGIDFGEFMRRCKALAGRERGE